MVAFRLYLLASFILIILSVFIERGFGDHGSASPGNVTYSNSAGIPGPCERNVPPMNSKKASNLERLAQITLLHESVDARDKQMLGVRCVISVGQGWRKTYRSDQAA